MTRKQQRTDNFPNYMSFTLSTSANDTFTTTQISSPVPRVGIGANNKATIMEITSAWFQLITVAMNGADENLQFALSTGGTPTAIPTLSNPNCIISDKYKFSLVTTGGSYHPSLMIYSMETFDGFGFLLATDSFHYSLDSNSTAGALTIDCRLYYRLVQIPITEYIGIVQSQQQSG